jgi:hypothetical protein
MAVMPPSRPDLRVFLLLVVAASVSIFAGLALLNLGFVNLGVYIAAPSVAVVLLLFWCLAFHVAPRFIRQATVVVTCASVVLSLLSCWISYGQEQARRIKAMDNLRQVGLGLHEHTSYAPQPEQETKRWVSQLLSESQSSGQAFDPAWFTAPGTYSLSEP